MAREEARRRFAAARVARLASADREGRPHLVPVTFAVVGEQIVSAVDVKPKRTAKLRRLTNIRVNPAVALLVDHYEEADWSTLWWVRADGQGRVLDPGEPEAREAAELLGARYPAFKVGGEVLAVDVERWSGWSASARLDREPPG